MAYKFLIINSDDFGMCHAANTATIDLLKKGGITSATIMTPCGWAKEAIEFSRDNPQFAIGIHLTFTSEWNKYKWFPLSRGENSSLRDEHGFIHKLCPEFEANAKPEEVEAEIRAQIAFAKGLGMEPSHLDNHMGSLYGLQGKQNFLPMVFRICAEMDYPFRMLSKYPEQAPEHMKRMVDSMAAEAEKLNVPILDHLWVHSFDGAQKESYENFRDYMYTRFENCPEGFVETYIHAAEESEELKNTSGAWRNRVWEYRLFADPATRQHIEAQGIQLIDYRDLKRMRRSGEY